MIVLVLAFLKLKNQLGETGDKAFRLLAGEVPGRHPVIVDRPPRAWPDASGAWLRRLFFRIPQDEREGAPRDEREGALCGRGLGPVLAEE